MMQIKIIIIIIVIKIIVVNKQQMQSCERSGRAGTTDLSDQLLHVVAYVSEHVDNKTINIGLWGNI